MHDVTILAGGYHRPSIRLPLLTILCVGTLVWAVSVIGFIYVGYFLAKVFL